MTTTTPIPASAERRPQVRQIAANLQAQHHAVIRQCVDLFYSQQGPVAELLHRVAFAAYQAGTQAGNPKATGGAA